MSYEWSINIEAVPQPEVFSIKSAAPKAKLDRALRLASEFLANTNLILKSLLGTKNPSSHRGC